MCKKTLDIVKHICYFMLSHENEAHTHKAKLFTRGNTMSSATITETATYTEDELKKMSVTNLRHVVRSIYDGKEKSKINFMTKYELISYVLNAQSGKESSILETLIEKDESKRESKSNGNGDLADVIANAIRDKIDGKLDENRVREIIEESKQKELDEARVKALIDKAIAESAIKKVVVEKIDGEKIEVGATHELFEKVLLLARMRKHTMLVGPSGSGKTHMCEQIAQALELKYYAMSVSRQTTKTDLFGFVDAHGKTVRSLFREAYENGGVFVLDEIDAGNDNVLTSMNAATSNKQAAFPDGMIEMHDDFILIACANTYGLGGDVEYVGRNQLDAATRNRFKMLYFDYDEKLEDALVGNKHWLSIVKEIRKIANELSEHVIASPRASIDGEQMIANGFATEECVDMCIYQGISKDVRSRIEARRSIR